MRTSLLSAATTLLLSLVVCNTAQSEQQFPLQGKRIVFFGDSITNAGDYISVVETRLRMAGKEVPELINMGLPSETCNGMSEPDHPFPRPNVHERLERALEKMKPDVVVACYGMNDGIYYPPSKERLDAYKKGIDGIIKKVHASGAKLILMTPPAYDPLPFRKKGKLLPSGAPKYSWNQIYENYNDVMSEFAAYVKSKSDEVEMVIDLYTPVTVYLANKRKADPEYVMSPDGVHVFHEGHVVLAAAILDAWDVDDSGDIDKDLYKLVSQRHKVMHDAWLSEVGHKRPGVKPGLPLAEAEEAADKLLEKIESK